MLFIYKADIILNLKNQYSELKMRSEQHRT